MNDIKPGDLCIVARDCCGHWLGRMIQVKTIYSSKIHCCECHYIRDSAPVAINEVSLGAMSAAPVSWLKKISPLVEDERIERQAETVT